MDKKKKKNIIDWIIKIVLIIIIIFLLLHNCALKKKQNEYENSPVPTGNVEIIEIKCDEDSCCINGKSDDNKGGKPASNDKDDLSGDVEVFDNDKNSITWNGATDLKIFNNSIYTVKDDIIAPESSNTYQFIVKNSTEYRIKYKINFIENNPYAINMKYKLKKNDTYLIDHYVSASELSVVNMFLNPDENDTYYLEWKWVSSSNDTAIGSNPSSKYGLKIEVKAESTNG